jgi:hypothetical protein
MEDYIQQVLAFDVTAGQPVRVEKLVALFTSHDNAVTEPLAAAGRHVLRYPDFAAALLAVSSVAANVWRATLAISREIAAPSTPSPSTQARQIRIANPRSSTPSRAIANRALVTTPNSATAKPRQHNLRVDHHGLSRPPLATARSATGTRSSAGERPTLRPTPGPRTRHDEAKR